jgi:hypothetical protein
VTAATEDLRAQLLAKVTELEQNLATKSSEWDALSALCDATPDYDTRFRPSISPTEMAREIGRYWGPISHRLLIAAAADRQDWNGDYPDEPVTDGWIADRILEALAAAGLVIVPVEQIRR